MQDFRQIGWDRDVEARCRELVRLALNEDLATGGDCTTAALIADNSQGEAAMVARQAGVVAGLSAAAIVLQEIDDRINWSPAVADGAVAAPGQTMAIVTGSAHGILAAERPMLNLVGRLSGIATLTRRYVDAVAGTRARIYDTRKTMPGWRLLEKYAVGRGGGHNHRTGLFDAILIKDNHLALGRAGRGIVLVASGGQFVAAEAVHRARNFLSGLPANDNRRTTIVEVEVESLDELPAVLAAGPDIVLLDNMHPEQLRQAVDARNQAHRAVELEASGGVNLETVATIAHTGVDRISAGAITHSAAWFDVALDWR